MGYSHGKQWTEDKIIKSIEMVMKALNINRMPSKTEMETVLGDSSLPNVISKNGGFYSWARELNISVKLSETQTGKGYEEVAQMLLNKKGYKVERMTTKYPYDLLVNNNIRIDVKAGRPYIMKGSRVHTIGINKKYATCDLYLIFTLNENDGIERTFIIPGNELKITSLNFGKNSKYNKYLDRWDLIDKYNEFYSKLA